MKENSNWIVIIVTCVATVVIAACAVTNCMLTSAIKTSSEKHQEKMNEILKESNRIALLIESNKTKRRLQKELDVEQQKEGNKG